MSLSKNIIIACAILLLSACGQTKEKDQYSGPPYPAIGNRVFDLENILSDQDSLFLNELFLNHQRKTSNQIALVTTDSLNGRENMAQFATFYFDDLGVGRSDLNNGVGIAVSRKLKSCYIVTGYGTEVVMGDEVVSRIVDSLMIPEFKDERYFEGLRSGSEAVIEYLERLENRMDLQAK